MKDLLRHLPAMNGKRIGVYGDLMADEYITGAIHRFSREAPVFIVDYQDSEIRGGGAANAVNNIRALGGKPVPFGVIGNDAAGDQLQKVLRETDINTDGVVVAKRPTFLKQRVIAGSPHSVKQQILRIDRCQKLEPDSELHVEVTDRLKARIKELDAFIISDYGHGTALPRIFRSVIEHSGIPCFVDSRSDLPAYGGATAATPNEPEVEAIVGRTLADANVRQAGIDLLRQLQLHALLVTRGSNGMVLFTRNADPVNIPIFGSSDIVDVTGAGDTVIASFTLAVAGGASYADAARLANCAAGLKVMKRGPATVSAAELTAALT